MLNDSISNSFCLQVWFFRMAWKPQVCSTSAMMHFGSFLDRSKARQPLILPRSRLSCWGMCEACEWFWEVGQRPVRVIWEACELGEREAHEVCRSGHGSWGTQGCMWDIEESGWRSVKRHTRGCERPPTDGVLEWYMWESGQGPVRGTWGARAKVWETLDRWDVWMIHVRVRPVSMWGAHERHRSITGHVRGLLRYYTRPWRAGEVVRGCRGHVRSTGLQDIQHQRERPQCPDVTPSLIMRYLPFSVGCVPSNNIIVKQHLFVLGAWGKKRFSVG